MFSLLNPPAIETLTDWFRVQARECQEKSGKIPLPFIIGVENLEEESWWRRHIKSLMEQKKEEDKLFFAGEKSRRNRLINLNREGRNGDDLVVYKYALIVMEKFDDPLVAVEMGSCYGGNVQDISELWRNRGVYYGMDTFEGHPKELGDKDSFEADCMDGWYKNPLFGKKRYTYKFQRDMLDKAGCTNAILVKGLVNDRSCDQIPKIHLAFLDMDMESSMRSGYGAVKDKVVKGGYLLLHDAVPDFHLPKVNAFYKEIAQDTRWKVISEDEGTYIVVLERI